MPVSKRPVESSSEVNYTRPYLFHGVQLTARGEHGVGTCPFCGREDKFCVAVDTGLWRCLVCGTGTVNGGGNALTFIRLLHAQSASSIKGIAADRKLLSNDAVAAWGMCHSVVDGHSWLVPGYSTEGRLDQLYKRVWVADVGKPGGGGWVLMPTPGLWPEGKVHALHLPSTDFDPKRSNIVICEGPWDGVATWEIYKNPDTNIVSVPGCNVWRDEWTEMCRGKTVTLMFDSDHPRAVAGGRQTRAGYDGMVRVAKKLRGVAAAVGYLRWGPDGYDPTRPSGWDVRDHLTSAKDRHVAMAELLSKVEGVPAEWFIGAPSTNGTAHVSTMESLDCSTWDKCEAAWKLAMQWRTDMSDALATLFAVCASTQQAGNQLFLDLVGSAGSGKTTLCEGLLVSNHCHHLEHLTGFHSGWKMADDQSKDCSPIARMNNKTLVTPEFDIMRSSPKYAELMGQTRRIFDGKSGATYKNTDKDTLYTGLRTPWIRAGTPAIMDTDQASMGDRFLRFIIADPSTEDEKRSIMRSALRSERLAMSERANGTAASIVDPKLRLAHALTGGYVDWLRAHVEEVLPTIDVSQSAEDHCIDLAEMSADLRARPNEDKRKRETHNSKELPTRLARQNIRMATCLAVALNKSSVDGDVLRIVRKIALDTAYGHSLNMVRWMCSPNPKMGGRSYQECGGLAAEILATWSCMSNDRLYNYLMFLREIGVVQWREMKQSNGLWLLTDRTYDLYWRITGYMP